MMYSNLCLSFRETVPLIHILLQRFIIFWFFQNLHGDCHHGRSGRLPVHSTQPYHQDHHPLDKPSPLVIRQPSPGYQTTITPGHQTTITWLLDNHHLFPSSNPNNPNATNISERTYRWTNKKICDIFFNPLLFTYFNTYLGSKKKRKFFVNYFLLSSQNVSDAFSIYILTGIELVFLYTLTVPNKLHSQILLHISV